MENKKRFECETPVKKALALWTPPHSAHPLNAAKVLVFSSLKNYKVNYSNKNNYSTQVNKLFNDILARGHTKKRIVDMLEELEIKIMDINKIKKYSNRGHKLTLKKVM